MSVFTFSYKFINVWCFFSIIKHTHRHIYKLALCVYNPMAEFKLTVSDPKTGKSYKRDVSGKEAEALLGKDINEVVSGDTLGFAGYEFEVTGGSDYAGFPMRYGLKGFGRKRILTYGGVGFSGRDRWGKNKSGLRVKTTICAQKIYPKISQVNLKIVKEGSVNLFTDAKAEDAKKAEPPAAS